MNASIFFKGRRRPIRPDFFRWKPRPRNFRSAQFFSGLLGESITRFATEWINRTGKQVERVVLNALETAALPPRTFLIQHCCEKLAFGNSIVLRTRRSTLTQVYV